MGARVKGGLFGFESHAGLGYDRRLINMFALYAQ